MRHGDFHKFNRGYEAIIKNLKLITCVFVLYSP